MLVYREHIRWSYESTCNYWPSIQLRVRTRSSELQLPWYPRVSRRDRSLGAPDQVRQGSSGFVMFVWKWATVGSPKPMICMKRWTSFEFWNVSRIIHRYAITQSIVQKPKCCPAYASDFPAYQQLSCAIFYFGKETKLWVWGTFPFQVFSAWFQPDMIYIDTLSTCISAFPSNEDTNLPEHSGTMATHSPWEFWWLGGLVASFRLRNCLVGGELPNCAVQSAHHLFGWRQMSIDFLDFWGLNSTETRNQSTWKKHLISMVWSWINSKTIQRENHRYLVVILLLYIVYCYWLLAFDLVDWDYGTPTVAAGPIFAPFADRRNLWTKLVEMARCRAYASLLNRRNADGDQGSRWKF